MSQDPGVKTPPVGIPLTAPCDGIPTGDVLARVGEALTYRQLNYWTSTGILGPVHLHSQAEDGRTRLVEPGDVHGSGYSLCYTAAQAAKAGWMARLIAATRTDGDEPIGPRLAARLFDGHVVADLAPGHRFILFAWEERPLADRPT